MFLHFLDEPTSVLPTVQSAPLAPGPLPSGLYIITVGSSEVRWVCSSLLHHAGNVVMEAGAETPRGR